MTDKKPRFVGMPESPDHVVESYKEAVKKRAAEARKQRQPLPNIPQANEQYKPGKDPPMTIQQIGEAQRAMWEGTEEKRVGLSDDTIAGMRALGEEMSKLRAQHEEKKLMEEKPVEAAPAEGDEPKTPEDLKREQLAKQVSDLDDLEFDQVMQRIRSDVINNEKEREAVKKRVEPMDLAEGLATGEFTQDVPIVPDKLVVRYRSISALENQAMRILLFKWVDAEPRLEGLAGELFGLMQVVASVKRVNTREFPSHMKGDTVYESDFDDEVFEKKFKLFRRYPAPLIHALGTHGFWFDQRVRELFTTENLKNG